VTLLEVSLAMGLLVLLSSITYWFYSSALETRDVGTQEARNLRLARVVLDRIATEIRQASAITADGRVGIRGEPERIWLSTLRVPTKNVTEMYRWSSNDEPPPGQYDLVKTEYKIARHEEVLDDDGYELALGLARVEIKVPRANSAETGRAFEDKRKVFGEELEGEGAGEEEGDGESAEAEEALTDEELFGDEGDNRSVGLGPDINWEELYAPEIRHLRFCYFDGYTWWNSWEVTGDNPLPQLVMVVIGFEGHPPFGEEFGETEEEEFCDCLNDNALECERLARDQFSTVVRVTQADPFFRSRISRETQAFMEELTGGAEDEDAEDEEAAD
jgi:hypothetical protein